MPSTPRGLPYPAATDPVAQGAAAIQALATSLDAYVRSCKVARATTFSLTSGSVTPIPWDNEIWDDDNIWDLANASRLTCRTAGRYLVVANVSFAPNSAGTLRQSRIGVGAAPTYLSVASAPPSAGHGSDHMNTTAVNLAVGDYLQLFAYHDVGAALTLSSTFATSLTIARI